MSSKITHNLSSRSSKGFVKFIISINCPIVNSKITQNLCRNSSNPVVSVSSLPASTCQLLEATIADEVEILILRIIKHFSWSYDYVDNEVCKNTSLLNTIADEEYILIQKIIHANETENLIKVND